MPDALIWPAVTLMLGIVAILALRGALVRLVDRISRAGKDGVSFERRQEEAEPKSEQLSFAEIMKHPISASALQREKNIQSELTSLKLTEQERVSVLVRGIAISRLELEFNVASNAIFGSQIGLLIQLSGKREGISNHQANVIFAEAQKNFPDLHGGRNVDEWLRYLEVSNLIAIHDGQIDITQYGTDFLKYLIEARLAYNRFG
jgi:hypothetical protein